MSELKECDSQMVTPRFGQVKCSLPEGHTGDHWAIVPDDEADEDVEYSWRWVEKVVRNA